MTRSAADDVSDFGHFFEAEFTRTARSVRAIVGTAAEDAAQEAFFAALQHWDRVRGLEAPGAWVRLAARRIAWRMRSRERGRGPREAAAAPRQVEAGPEPIGIDIHAALRGLSPRFRSAIVLHHLAGLSVAEVAEALGTTESATKVMLFRARNRLADDLGGHRGRWLTSRVWRSEDVVAAIEMIEGVDAGAVDLVAVAAREVRWSLTLDRGRYEIGTDDGQRLDQGAYRIHRSSLELRRPDEPGRAVFTTTIDAGRARLRQVSNSTRPTHGIADSVYLHVLVASDTLTWDRGWRAGQTAM